MERWVKDVLEYAQENGLDLKAKEEAVLLTDIEVTESVDAKAVEAIKRRFKKSEWPNDLPLIVLASNIGEGYQSEKYVVLDGHHRLAAAEQLGAEVIPALVVSYSTYEAIATEFDVPRVDYIEKVLAAADDKIARNVRKGSGGSPKKRSR